MNQLLRLSPPAGIALRIQDAVPTPHELPLSVALESARDPAALVFWRSADSTICGIFHGLGRTAWPHARLRRLHAVVIRPGAGPGATGLELVLEDGAELPLLVVRPYREDFANWLATEMETIGRFLEVEMHWKDYGLDR
jgi:hypothetical protein